MHLNDSSRAWIKRAGEVARAYHQNRAELGRRKRYDRKAVCLDMPKSKGISKPVEQAALRIASNTRINQLEKEIEAVEWAFSVLEQMPGQDAAALLSFADTLYRRRDHPSVEGCARVLFLNRATAFRYNRNFLKLVAARLGIWAPKESA